MILQNSNIFLFAKFVWCGLGVGFVAILFSLIIKATRRNVYVYNLVTFCFWIVFGLIFADLSLRNYNYSFCWFGLAGMFVGYFLVKISIEFLFTKFIKLLYNKLTNKREDVFNE